MLLLHSVLKPMASASFILLGIATICVQDVPACDSLPCKLQVLQKSGADFSAVAVEGSPSPLELATKGGHLECVEFLLQQFSTGTGAGNSSSMISKALRVAAKVGHGGCLEALLRAGAAVLEAAPRSQLLALALSKGIRGGWLSALLPEGDIEVSDLESWALAALGDEGDAAVLGAVDAVDEAVRGGLPQSVLFRIAAVLCCLG